MAALIASMHDRGVAAVWHGLTEFAAQLVIGAGVGALLGWALILAARRFPLASEALYPLRTVVAAAFIYGAATIAHGSGFLAVFVAGIMFGDQRVPFKSEIRRTHASLASLGEIVAFIVLGLTINLRQVVTTDAWWIGLVLAVLLALLARPLLVGPLLLPVDLRPGEKAFVLWAGLKGAVPILLGTFAFATTVDDPRLIYHVIFVVVLFSVLVQGGLVPWVARRCGVPMRPVAQEPWALGLRFREEPRHLRHYQVRPGAPADGASVASLPLSDGVWLSVVTRDGALLPLTGQTVLRAHDEILAQVDGPDPAPLFEPP
jgi:potassium/hydrogen antiporter